MLGQDKVEIFHIPSSIDLISISSTFDERELLLPPTTYYQAKNVSTQISDLIENVKREYESTLLFIGLTGSRAVGTNRDDSDIDIIVILSIPPKHPTFPFEGDLKIISLEGLKQHIKNGMALIISQVRTAITLYSNNFDLDSIKKMKPNRKESPIFLKQYAESCIYSSDIFNLVSSKYKQGSSAKLKSLRLHYNKLAINRIYHALTSTIQAQHIKKHGDICEFTQLINSDQLNEDTKVLLAQIISIRKKCYKENKHVDEKIISQLISEVKLLIE